jgi:hypothetical protein
MLCLVWFGWTIVFIFNSVRNQKIIYQILNEISVDIEIIGKELNPIDRKNIDNT